MKKINLRLFTAMMLATLLWSNDMLACMSPDIHNYYLFSTIGKRDFQMEVNRKCYQNWRAYADRGDDFWYDADSIKAVARQKNDLLMVSYVDNLQRYLKCIETNYNQWEYPSRETLDKNRRTITAVRQYAASKLKTRLRSQHALLYMRCNMQLSRHAENVSFWEKTASGYINSVYKDMMRNIYAGALVKSGRSDEASLIYAEQGDIESLYTFYYKKRSCKAIAALYDKSPQSPAFRFLLQDFANNAQETIDALNEQYNWPGKLFVHNVQKAEAHEMIALCRRVISEGKADEPALWQSLSAWLQYLYADKREALTTINKAVGMEGSQRVKDNARVLQIFIESEQSRFTDNYCNHLADQLKWLDDKAVEERGGTDMYENHYTQVYDRLVHQVMMPKLQAAGHPELATAALARHDEMPFRFYHNDNIHYSTELAYHLDTVPLTHLERYFDLVKGQVRGGQSGRLAKWLLDGVRRDTTYLHEMLGTRYLREGQWANAIRHLEHVPLDFINKMNIAPYMAQRRYDIPAWLNRQRLKESQQQPGYAFTKENQKLAYAREMLRLEQGFGILKGEEQCRRAYDIAVRRFQASRSGDAWYLTYYGRSNEQYATEGLEAKEMHHIESLLLTASSSSDFKLRELSLFALAFLPFDEWFVEEWSSEKTDFVKVLRPNSYRYQALDRLAAFKTANGNRTSSYVSKCDVLKQFMKSKD